MGVKLDRLRELRERRYASASAASTVKAVVVVEPSGGVEVRDGTNARPRAKNGTFDKVGYQRSYMRRWRASKKGTTL